MSDRDLRQSLADTAMGAAALGLCIARVLAQSDPTILQNLLAEAEKMQYGPWQHTPLGQDQSETPGEVKTQDQNQKDTDEKQRPLPRSSRG